MWHDTDAGYHYGYDFYDDDYDPMDTNGHGTHCCGTVGSDGTAGNECGVAPGATIMACRVNTTVSPDAEANIWWAMEWSCDQGADVLSMSLGYLQSWNPQRTEWREAEEAVLAAGVIHSVAAGNESGNPSTWGDIRTPGDVVPPWLHPEQTTTGGLAAVVTVGSTDSGDNLSSFSSVGYSTWMYDPPWYDYPDTSPDIGLIDPDVVAPGSNILSCSHTSTSGYTTMSGTSMATPHTAGLMALVLDANPSLSVATIDSIIEVTALELGDPGKDNEFGAGRIRAPEAVTAALSVGIEEDMGGVPEPGVLLSPVYPNPVSSVAFFDVYFPNGGSTRIEVFDLSGRIVDSVASGQLAAGSHSLSWTVPESVAGGIYFLRAQGEGQIVSRRITVIR